MVQAWMLPWTSAFIDNLTHNNAPLLPPSVPLLSGMYLPCYEVPSHCVCIGVSQKPLPGSTSSS